MIEVLPTIAHMGQTTILRFWNSETDEWIDIIVRGPVIVSKSTDNAIMNRNMFESAEAIQDFINRDML